MSCGSETARSERDEQSHEIVKYALLLDLNPTMNSLAVVPLLIPPPPALQ